MEKIFKEMIKPTYKFGKDQYQLEDANLLVKRQEGKKDVFVSVSLETGIPDGEYIRREFATSKSKKFKINLGNVTVIVKSNSAYVKEFIRVDDNGNTLAVSTEFQIPKEDYLELIFDERLAI